MNAPAAIQSQSLITRFASRFGVEPTKLLVTLKATAFRSDHEVTNEQMMALLVVVPDLSRRRGPFPSTGNPSTPPAFARRGAASSARRPTPDTGKAKGLPTNGAPLRPCCHL